MTVPALATADIATFAYWRQTSCTYVQLADVLPILHSYRQFAEYVDGTIKIFDTGSESVEPNNYVLMNVRIRADGWIMAWFPQELMTGTAVSGSGVVVNATGMQITRNGAAAASAVVANELAGYTFKPTSGSLSGNEYTIQNNTATAITLHGQYGDSLTTNVGALGAATYEILQSRGNIVWWGHNSNTTGNPTSQSTRFGRALYEMWESLKGNQKGGSGAVLIYADVGYWDYEYTSATHLYIIGYSGVVSGASTVDKHYYFTAPAGVTMYDAVFNYGLYANWTSAICRGYINAVMKYSITAGTGQRLSVNGYSNINITTDVAAPGVQHTVRSYGKGSAIGGAASNSQGIVLLTSG